MRTCQARYTDPATAPIENLAAGEAPDGQSGHTPTPWAVSWMRWSADSPVLGFAIRSTDADVCRSKHGVSIASIGCAEPQILAAAVYENGELEANAELIVKAVNEYAISQALMSEGAQKILELQEEVKRLKERVKDQDDEKQEVANEARWQERRRIRKLLAAFVERADAQEIEYE